MTARNVLDDLRWEVCSRCHGLGIATLEDMNALPPGSEMDITCPACHGDAAHLVTLGWWYRFRRALRR